jgi:hypothetical protein
MEVRIERSIYETVFSIDGDALRLFFSQDNRTKAVDLPLFKELIVLEVLAIQKK